MALAAFSDNFALYDVTPVENIFLLEYMPYAPGDYVRVYLYGLMLCRYPDREGTAESMAKALNMEAGQVLDALRYWEKKGLLEGVGDNPPRFLFRNVRSAMQDLPPREDNPAMPTAISTTVSKGCSASCIPSNSPWPSSGWKTCICPPRWCCTWRKRPTSCWPCAREASSAA